VNNFLIEKVGKDLTKFKSKKILLAHSGGIDSSVLADILLKLKIDFSIAHCNFQLRGAESDNDSKFVSVWCDRYNIPFFYSKFSTKEYCEINNINIQLGTRELRYKWFFELQNIFYFDFIFTAHHLNDQFETFLINSSRGSGLKGLLGIINKNKVVRPLLFISKKEIINYAKKNNLSWREDNSNIENYYLRNKFRNKIVPDIEMMIPDFLNKFRTTLRNLHETREFINNSIEKIRKKIFVYDNSLIRVNIDQLLKLKTLNFYLHELFSLYGFKSKDISKLLLSSTGKQLFSKTHRMLVDRGELIINKIKEIEKSKYLLDLNDKKVKLPINLDFKYINSYDKKLLNHRFAWIDLNKIKDPLYLRKPESKDYFYPIGMKGKKLVSKYFKDEKYSIYDKENQWLLVSNKDVVWVVGKRLDSRFAADKNSTKVLQISCIS